MLRVERRLYLELNLSCLRVMRLLSVRVSELSSQRRAVVFEFAIV